MTRVSLCCRVFKPCHSVIPPWPYYQACAFDQCHAPTVDTRCSSLELYAALCASLSVCIDWRGLTAHECRECPLPPRPRVPRPAGRWQSACSRGQTHWAIHGWTWAVRVGFREEEG